ncbi:PIG-U-domain-containing protein [Hygrophoropsis aurantiaca]|uniref:PIG-U-domain-containing protein n=1 Tax=Hygrophoropsis aurantiaca TaxID=72124 RepID=A0ACB7ZRY0_9AGAM|nr:PIG-U-domain-containing protein [Hygrophoropsis aurantiaca]
MDARAVFALLVSGRLGLALSFPWLPDALKYDHMLSSPLTARLRLQEGIFLYQHDIDPYSGSAFRHSPLYLSLFTTLLPIISSPTACILLWTAADALAAYSLVRIWRARAGGASERDGLVAAAYLLNPYLFLPSLGLSTSTFENLSILLALMFACEGSSSPALLAFALATHLTPPLSSLLLLLPLLGVLLSGPASSLEDPCTFTSPALRMTRLGAEYLTYVLVLGAAAAIVVGDDTYTLKWGWVGQTWGTSLTLPDLTPNIGLWWYFFTEMFDHFRPFFLGVFSIHLVIYIMPISIKFQHDPLYASFLLIGILATFKAYLTLADPGLFLSMGILFPEVWTYLRHPLPTFLLHLHAALLLPLLHALWTSHGTGNANFFYAATLVMGVANGAGVVDWCWAGMRIAIGGRGGVAGGRKIRVKGGDGEGVLEEEKDEEVKTTHSEWELEEGWEERWEVVQE